MRRRIKTKALAIIFSMVFAVSSISVPQEVTRAAEGDDATVEEAATEDAAVTEETNTEEDVVTDDAEDGTVESNGAVSVNPNQTITYTELTWDQEIATPTYCTNHYTFTLEKSGLVSFETVSDNYVTYKVYIEEEYNYSSKYKTSEVISKGQSAQYYLYAGTYYMDCSARGDDKFTFSASYQAIDNGGSTSIETAPLLDMTNEEDGTLLDTKTFEATGCYYASPVYYQLSVPRNCLTKVTADDASSLYLVDASGNKYTYSSITNGISAIMPQGTVYLLVYPSTRGTYHLTVSYGDSSSCKVSKTPSIWAQTSALTNSSTVYYNQTRVLINLVSTSDADAYEIYRSTSANGKYKLVKTVANSSKYGYGSYTSKYWEYVKSKEYWVLPVADTGLSSNHAYYYKVRLKKKINGITCYSSYSAAKGYWTCLKTKKVKDTETYQTSKWKKVSGASGYLVREKFTYFRGYNIYGKRLYGTEDRVTKTTSTSKTKISYKWHLKVKSCTTVIAFKKHGNYYYVNGYKPISSSQMKDITKDLQDTATYNAVFK